MSPRESEVLAALGEHLTNAEIAARLFISVRTVESHVSSLLRKLDLPDRRALAAYAAATTTTAGGGPEVTGLVAPAEPPTSFVGREHELAEVAGALRSSTLVTLLGPGGAGKTRLAARVAAGERSVFVDLVPVAPDATADSVAAAVAAAAAIAEPVARSVLDALAGHLPLRCRLVVLDNCEHVLDGAAEVAARLATTPNLRVLTTSRERLAVQGEAVVPIGSLDGAEATRLFVERAAAADPTAHLDPALVTSVCERLDRLPLAIELAASRLAVFDLADLAERLDRPLDLLGGGDRSRRRHRTLRDTVEWSFQLLDEPDRAVHRRLSVLPGPFRLAVAERVAGGSVVGSVAASVASLVEASLLVRRGTRYRQLELVRAHAGERLDAAGEGRTVRDRLVEWASESLASGGGGDTVEGDEADLRAAADAAAEIGRPDAGELFEALAGVWERRERWTDALDALERAVGASRDHRVAMRAGDLAWSRWRGDQAVRLFGLAMDLAAEAGDAAGEAEAATAAALVETRFVASVASRTDEAGLTALLSRAADAEERLRAAGEPSTATACRLAAARSFVADRRDDALERRSAADEALRLAEQVGDPILLSSAFDAVASSAQAEGDIRRMAEVTERRFALVDGLTGRRGEVERIDLLLMAADAAIRLGRFPAALERTLALRDAELRRGVPHSAWARVVTAEFFLGAWDDCVAHARIAEEAWQADGGGAAGWLIMPFTCAGAVAGYRGDFDEQRRWEASGRQAVGTTVEHCGVKALRADVHLHHGRRAEAAVEVGADPATFHGFWRSLYAATRAEVLEGEARAEVDVHIGADAYAAAVVERARGDLSGAYDAFVRCGARYQAARTGLLLGGERAVEAKAVYAALGLT